jgi:cell division protein FtsZ
VSVTILATGFKTNPNQLLQPKKEPRKFNLEEENVVNEPEETDFREEETNVEEVLFETEEKEVSQKNTIKPEPPKKDKSEREQIRFASKMKREKKKKEKAEEPVTQSSIDNWFYKNFGLGRLFEDDDQSLEE